MDSLVVAHLVNFDQLRYG
jgi:hypothetical protein